MGPATAPTGRGFWLALAAICVVGLCCRLVILSDYISYNPMSGTPVNDADTYWQWAGRIAGGQLTQDVPFFSAPLYPYLLGLARWLGGTLTTVYVLQLLADLMTACLLAIVCRRRFGASVGLLAAGLFLLLQEPASFSLRILPATLHLLLVTVVWASLVGVQAKRSMPRLIAAGVMLGLLCLAYAPAMMLVAPVALWLFYQSARRLRDAARAAVPVLAAALVIAPATLHNWAACGELFFVQAVSGITLRLGNQPNADGNYVPIPGISTLREQMHEDAARMYHKATGEQPTWKKVDRYFRDQVFQDWQSDPLGAVRLAARKLYWFLSSRNYGDIYQPGEEIARGLNRWLRLAPLPTPWLIGPALVGLVLVLRHPIRHAPEWMLFGVPLLVVVVFWYSPRFRMPAVPIMAITAAWAIERALHWRTCRGHIVAVASTFVAGVLLGVVNRTVGFDLLDHANVPFNLAHILHQQGDTEAAVEKLREGLNLRPGDTAKWIALGDLLRSLDLPDEALAEYRRGLLLNPDDVGLLGVVGKALLQQQKIAEAQQVLAAAVRQHPADADLLSALADAKQMAGDTDEACALYKRALELAPENMTIRADCGILLMRLRLWEEARGEFATVAQALPGDFQAQWRLGRIAVHLGDFDEARTRFERALQIRPQSVKALYDLGGLSVMQGRYDEAAEYFRMALDEDPEDEQCLSALERLQLLRSGQRDTGS
ncbi:MAG: tetratricopeptide repeat protein [Phycisphaerae bacterium]|nr:tetratricopeptide repeat protein [Phycisphaerae bacterium]